MPRGMHITADLKMANAFAYCMHYAWANVIEYYALNVMDYYSAITDYYNGLLQRNYGWIVETLVITYVMILLFLLLNQTKER